MSDEKKLDVIPDAQEFESTKPEMVDEEVRTGMPELVAQQQAMIAHLVQGGSSGISGDFGKLKIESDEMAALAQSGAATHLAQEGAMLAPIGDAGAGQEAAVKPGAAKPGDANAGRDAAKAAADAPSPDTPAAVSARFESNAKQALVDSQRALKVTNDGAPAKTIEYQDRFKIEKDMSAIDLASSLAGPNATKEQIEFYAQQILVLNERYTETIQAARFAAGQEIKLPGQLANGGVVGIKQGVVTTEWSNGGRSMASETGEGRVNFTDARGVQVEISWNPRDLGGNSETRMTNDRESTTDAKGKTTERIWRVTDEATGDGDWLTTEISTTDEKGRRFKQEFTPGNASPDRIILTNPDNSTIELKPNNKGEYVAADGKIALSDSFLLYARNEEADGTVTRSYENGDIEKYEPRGRIVSSQGTDEWGRAFAYEYKAGERTPFKATLTTKSGDAVDLARQRNGSYKGDYIKDGAKIGSIDLGADGRLIYRNDRENTVTTELKDGTVLEKKVNADKTSTISYTRGGDGFVVDYDAKGGKTKEVFTGADGRKTTRILPIAGKQDASVKIESPDGSITELKYDRAADSFKGERRDKSGAVVEHVGLQEDKLIFIDVKTAAVRAEKFIKPSDESPIPSLMPGTYDKDTGTFTYTNPDKSTTVESFAPGRTDSVRPDGTIQGTTKTGDFSVLRKDGEATVLHSDGTGVRLNTDGTIDRWGPRDRDNAHKERLSPVEEQFLRGHPDIDRRDFAEIHRKLANDPAKLDSFIIELSKIDSAKNLSDREKSALRKDIMRHVAYPGEIYQGRTPSCNVSVVERDVAMLMPDSYAKMIVEAVSEGSVTLSDGSKVPLDPNNLKLADSSGRNLASRIFQTAAIQAEFHPRRVFRNSEDGVGRLYPTPYNPADKPIVFAGMNMAHIIDIRHKLTGEEKTVALIDNTAELIKAFEINGGGPMIAAVDGSKPPFENNGPVGPGSSANHVVTITRIESGPPVKVYLHNQWGLANDHSTKETAVDGAKLIENMRVKVRVGGKLVTASAMVITKGDHTKAYDISRGRLVESKSLTATLKKGGAMIPGESP